MTALIRGFDVTVEHYIALPKAEFEADPALLEKLFKHQLHVWCYHHDKPEIHYLPSIEKAEDGTFTIHWTSNDGKELS